MSDTLFVMALVLLQSLPILSLFSVINKGMAGYLFTSISFSLFSAILCNSTAVFCIAFPSAFATILLICSFSSKLRKIRRFIVVENTQTDGLYVVFDGRRQFTLPLLDQYETGSIIFVRSTRFD